jgi:DNA polymerase-3 subunit gamma/tau
MSYQVLARKWRPRSFREMVGQTHVLKALINALDSQRLHHAYLFTGTRGVGKTTIARIIAKCLNCETGITSTPCGECSVCREIDEGRFVDLIEIDALKSRRPTSSSSWRPPIRRNFLQRFFRGACSSL